MPPIESLTIAVDTGIYRNFGLQRNVPENEKVKQKFVSSTLPRKRGRTSRDLCRECWRENADVIDSFSITVAPTK
jgi:hypothetical protein